VIFRKVRVGAGTSGFVSIRLVLIISILYLFSNNNKLYCKGVEACCQSAR
jgi:hypothetical protein